MASPGDKIGRFYLYEAVFKPLSARKCRARFEDDSQRRMEPANFDAFGA